MHVSSRASLADQHQAPPPRSCWRHQAPTPNPPLAGVFSAVSSFPASQGGLVCAAAIGDALAVGRFLPAQRRVPVTGSALLPCSCTGRKAGIEGTRRKKHRTAELFAKCGVLRSVCPTLKVPTTLSTVLLIPLAKWDKYHFFWDMIPLLITWYLSVCTV